jgi:hypothetical protein
MILQSMCRIQMSVAPRNPNTSKSLTVFWNMFRIHMTVVPCNQKIPCEEFAIDAPNPYYCDAMQPENCKIL